MDAIFERLDLVLEALDELEDRAAAANEDENDSLMEDINSARREYEEVKTMAEEAEQSDEESFEEMQAAVETALDELEEGIGEIEERIEGQEDADEE